MVVVEQLLVKLVYSTKDARIIVNLTENIRPEREAGKWNIKTGNLSKQDDSFHNS